MYNLVTIADNTRKEIQVEVCLIKLLGFFDTGETWQA